MRIDGLNDNRINVEAVNKNENRTLNGNSLKEAVVSDNKTVTMTSADISKGGVFGIGEGEDSFDDIKEKAELLKNSFEALKDKMETGGVVDMNEEELDVNNTEVDKIVTVAERIRIKLALYCDDYSIEGTGISIDDIKATMGEYVATYKAAATMSDSAKSYLVKNELEPTIENIYKAIHSGAVDNNANTLTDAEWNEIKPQAERIIKEAGLEINEEHFSRSRYMIENGIDLTVNNLQYYDILDGLELSSDDEAADRIAATITEGKKSGQTKVTGESLPFEEAAMAIQVIMSAKEGHIMALSKEDVRTTDALFDIESKNISYIPDKTDIEYLKTYRQIQEIRLMMTIDAGRAIENSGVSINTTELSELVDRLRSYEADMLSATLPEGEEKVTVTEVNEINEVFLAMEELKTAPAAVLGMASKEDIVSPQVLLTKRFVSAGEAYEALSTEVRTDLGDSVFKAVKAITDSILSELGYEDNEENRRAVRILAYNEMEMSKNNIDVIKDLDISVNTLFKKMTPEKTLKMIRDGVNPLTSDIRELTDYFNDMPEEMAVEKYSEFLYKLQKNSSITEDEREKYIAIYSLINKFEKDGMNAVGSLYVQGLEFNMGNLLTAYMTRKSGGVDVVSDVTDGMAEIKDKASYYKHLFAGVREKVMPEVLSSIDNIDEFTMEDFVSEVQKSEKYEPDDIMLENLKNAVFSEDDVIKMIAEYDIPSTPNYITEVKKLLKEPEKIFDSEKEYEYYDKISDKNSLVEEYEINADEAKNELRNALFEKDEYLDINSLKQINLGMNLVSHLAKRNNFYIPCRQDGKEMVINLKIVEESDESGKFQITFENEKYGRVSIEGKVSTSGIHVQILSDSDEAVSEIRLETNALETLAKNEGYEKINIFVNKSDERPSIHPVSKSDVSTEKIFKTTKIFVTHFAN